MSDLTLYRVAEDFRSMVELRAQMQELGEDTGPLDQQIAEYFSNNVTRDKIDNVIGYYRHCKMLEEEAVREDERLLAAIKSLRTRAAWLLDFCKGAMEITGQKKLEGKTRGSLSLRTNGGKQALKVTDASLLPEDLVEYRGSFSGKAIGWLRSALGPHITDNERSRWEYWSGREDVQMERIPHDGRIRAALEQKCHNCDGTGRVIIYSQCIDELGDFAETSSNAQCSDCEGDGKAGVPGARLEERGQHVEVK